MLLDVVDPNAGLTVSGENMWQGASVQLAIDASGSAGTADKTNTYFELGFALEASRQVATHAWSGNFDWSTVRTSGEKTKAGYRLQISIPWKNLSLDPGNLPESIGINIVVNGRTEAGRRRFVEWTPGTAAEKNPRAFARAVLRPADSKAPAWIFLQQSSYDTADPVEGMFVEYAAAEIPAGPLRFSLGREDDWPERERDALPKAMSRTMRFLLPAADFPEEGGYWLKALSRTSRGERKVAAAPLVRVNFQTRLDSDLAAVTERLEKLRASVSARSGLEQDPYIQMGLRLAERFIERVPRETLESEQSRDWKLLQLREVHEVLAATEERLSGPVLFSPRPAWEKISQKDGVFYAAPAGSARGAPERPFYFYGYGHFASVLGDLPILSQLGVTLIQQDHGMREMQPDGFLRDGGGEIITKLEQAAANGVKVDLLLSPHYLPSWLLDNPPPGFLVKNATGIITYNIDHPAAKKLISDYLHAFIPVIKDAEGLFSICLANEPNYTNSGRDEDSRPLWAKYLEERHGAVAALNELYGASYASFDEVPVPEVGMPEDLPKQRAYYDWIRFHQKHFANWHREMNGIVKAAAPGVPTSVKIMANIFDRETLARGVDPELFCAFTDLAGNDCWAYPGPSNGYAYDWQLEEMWYDLLHSFQGQPVFNSENHLIRDNSPPVSVSPQSTRCVLWQGAMHHQAATTMWIWEEPNHMDLQGSIFLRPANIHAAGRTMLDLNRLGAEVAALSEQKSEVAILYSVTSLFWQDDYPKALAAVYAALNFGGKAVTFISEDQLSSGARSSANDAVRCIVLPRATHVKKSTAAALADFHKKGGAVLAVGDDNLGRDDYARKTAAPAGLENAPVVPWRGAQDPEFAPALYVRLRALGIAAEPLLGPDGNPLRGVEYRRVFSGDRELISMTNLSTSEQTAGWPADGPLLDLMDQKEVDAKAITLKPMEPRLLEVKK